MANSNYLPVLIVSVTNAVPDDTFVKTQAHGQVDYLSHEWQEEDVWKSWRNMTKQKNEIANGVRLENASWRTWWKQRNKLKTVTPETLNWLKDSDVTWLYGPLHTANDYKPSQNAGAVSESSSQSSNRDQKPSHKPILKHRSISELLTSDLPNSPIFSPPESEDEDDGSPSIYDSLDLVTREQFISSQKVIPKRPSLQHTKSDTHITRWGPSRAFRKDSPPRIEPPGQHNADNYFPQVTAGGPVRSSLSQDSNSSTANSQNGERTKKKHISFNTFVEQCIAIDKPKRSNSFCGNIWGTGRNCDDDDGYEEDQEDFLDEDAELDAPWGRQRISNDRGSDSDSQDEEEDGIIEMRTSYRDTPKKQGPRSHSKVSNASSSSSVSTGSSATNSTNNSSSPSRSSVSTAKRGPPTRRHSGSTYRPRSSFIRTLPSDHVHVTIAPIAPTVLKTTRGWEEGFGDDCGSDDALDWRDRIWKYNNSKRNQSDDEGQASDGTPVELVYVPPFNSRYAFGYEDDLDEAEELGFIEEDGFEEDEEDDEYSTGIIHTRRFRDDSTTTSVFRHRDTVVGSVGFDGFGDERPIFGSPDGDERDDVAGIPIPIPATDPDDLGFAYPSQSNSEATTIPRVVLKQDIHSSEFNEEQELYGPDLGLGDEYMSSRPSRGREAYSTRSRNKIRADDDRPSRSASRTASSVSSRSRSKSHSRTPSPNLDSVSAGYPSLASSAASLQTPSAQSLRPPLRRASSSLSAPDTTSGSPSLLSPPRGRSHSYQDLQGARAQSQSSSRGRSSTRTPSSSALDSSSSPLGSLSPDVVAAYIGGGRPDRGDKDSRRGRDTGRERGRGRSQTTDKKLSVSLSNSPEPPRSVEESKEVPFIPPPPSIRNEASFSSTCSSSSSTKTVVPEVDEALVREAEFMSRAEEELRRRTTPTPSNSPVIEMRAPIVDHVEHVAKPVYHLPASSAAATSTRAPPTPTSPTPTPTKSRPPLLAPSPPHTAPPSSSSYTAISSPSPTSPRESMSPQRLASPSAADGVFPTPEPRSPLRSPDLEGSIIGKAAEIVSTAGAYLGFWQH
ncbi:hypothetical protein FA15DRAFT_699884 [Coprinopsis marcescibilis]|uniref:Nitrogen regulatory protein areA GATA-like domain-containing protein n=1 Tax=Coprinopsis marcescibilis TaxID=230819 RepID=A0A5C3L9V2_COPMA|nr:hypothetical protein FA15DRAFT_699884 [Coprinopsis marcescibilis]